MVRLEWVVRVKVVVAQQWVAGAEARVVEVVQLVVVATLAVAGLALGAEEPQQLGYHDWPHGSCRRVLDTKYHQIFQSFVFVVYSTFHLQCLFFLFFLLLLTTVQLLLLSTMLIATLSFSSNPSPSFKTGSGSKVIWGM
jgi:hypothetical protein